MTLPRAERSCVSSLRRFAFPPHVVQPIALERCPAALGGDRDQIFATVCIAEGASARCAGEKSEEIALGEIVVVHTQIHCWCSDSAHVRLMPIGTLLWACHRHPAFTCAGQGHR